MGIFNVGKAAKFAFVTMPLSIFGWQLNKRLFLWIRSFWVHSVNPACPVCDNGVMFSHPDGAPVFEQERPEDRPRELYPWVCDHCGYALLESLDSKRVRATVGRHRQERARVAFSDMEWQEREQITRTHRIGSRIFFVVAALTFANSVYMLGTGVSLILTLNWASFALMFWIFGMKRAYRAWQVMSGHLFESGAFWHWLKHEKWLI